MNELAWFMIWFPAIIALILFVLPRVKQYRLTKLARDIRELEYDTGIEQRPEPIVRMYDSSFNYINHHETISFDYPGRNYLPSRKPVIYHNNRPKLQKGYRL